MSFFTPWRTIRLLRNDLAHAHRMASLEMEETDRHIAEAHNGLAQLKMQLSASYNANAALLSDVRKYRELLQQAHFRQPDTGRIGKKGQLPGAEPERRISVNPALAAPYAGDAYARAGLELAKFGDPHTEARTYGGNNTADGQYD